MAEPTLSLTSLKLNVDEREQVASLAADLIAVHVYRELQNANSAAARVAGDSGCNIIGNCSSSSKNALLGRTLT